MCEAVAGMSIAREGATLRATISISLSKRLSGEHSLDVVLSRADEARYAAKAAGRNCIKATWGELQPQALG